MPEHPSSFFTYPRWPLGDPPREKAYILFHATKPRWLVANGATLEILHWLDRGDRVGDVINRLAERYGIPLERAKHDVLHVSDRLFREHFLERDAPNRSPGKPLPETLFLHLTDRCNLSCLHCYFPGHEKSMDLPVSLVIRLIDEAAANGGQHVILSGGEPLLHPGIKRILEHAAPKLEVRLLTNGTLIDREWAAFLADLNVQVQLSMESPRQEIHDRIRGNGNLEKTVRAVTLFQEQGMGDNLILSTTIMKHNVHDLSEIISFAESRNVPRVRFLSLMRQGRAAQRWDEIGSIIQPEDQEAFYDYAIQLQANRKCSIEISCGLSGFMLHIPEKHSDDNHWCSVASTVAVGVNGDAFPCVLMMYDTFKLGNVFQSSLKELLRSDTMAGICRTRSLRRSRIKKCGDCNWRNFCQAGCMGQALDQTGSLWETDSFCDFRKRAYQKAFNKILLRHANGI